MSLIIAIKDDNGVYVGADRQGTMGQEKRLISKITRAKQSDKIIIGGVGNYSQYIAIANSNKLFPTLEINESIKDGDGDIYLKSLTEEKIRENIRINILKILKEQEIIIDKNDLNVDVLLVIDNEVYGIYSGGLIFKIGDDEKDYIALGSGDTHASVYLNLSSNVEPKKRITEAIKIASKDTIYVNDNIEILENKKGE